MLLLGDLQEIENYKMTNKFFCPYWGSTLNWSDFIDQVKASGYDGIEVGVARDTSEEILNQQWGEAEKNGLLIIAQHYDTNDGNFSRHYDTYAQWLEKMRPFKPFKINSQTGRDFFTFDQNKLDTCGLNLSVLFASKNLRHP